MTGKHVTASLYTVSILNTVYVDLFWVVQENDSNSIQYNDQINGWRTILKEYILLGIKKMSTIQFKSCLFFVIPASNKFIN